MLYGIENYGDGSQGATVSLQAKTVINGTPVILWPKVTGKIPIVLGLVGTVYASQNTTGVSDAMQITLMMNSESHTPAVFSQNVGAGLSVRINDQYGPGWNEGAENQDVTISIPNGYSAGEMIWSGFIFGRYA